MINESRFFHREEFMSATSDQKRRAGRRHLPAAEKHRLVELTLRDSASLVAIAREHGVHPKSLGRWKSLYRAGELSAPVKPTARVAGPTASATFFPVSVAAEVFRSGLATRADAAADRSGIMQLAFASGATLRIEIAALDAALVCALVAELKR
jgi:transposase-like protein